MDLRSVPDRRTIWAIQRSTLETALVKSQRDGTRHRRKWDFFDFLLKGFGVGLKLAGLEGRGIVNARNVEVRSHELHFPNLPSAFDGYTILHLTDIHFDCLSGIEDIIINLIKDLKIDLAVLTGDYRNGLHGSHHQIVAPMAKLAEAIRAPDGIFATLGNHDTVHMVSAIEKMGVRVLANETAKIERQNSHIFLTGIDDVHYYYSDMALEEMDNTPQGFKIILVHSAEIADLAAERGYSLYLAGHTHGGQICWPNGSPVFTHLNAHRRFASGLWRLKGLVGYTNRGAGTVVLPVRFFSRGEIAVITLRAGG